MSAKHVKGLFELSSFQEGDTIINHEGDPIENSTCLDYGYAVVVGDSAEVRIVLRGGASTTISKETFQAIAAQLGDCNG